MTTVTYIGPFAEVEIASTGQICARDGWIEVDDDLAASLLEQTDTWAPKPKTKKGDA
jgi:hypothetical protein